MSDTNAVAVRYARSSTRTFPIALSPNELTALRVTGTPNLAYNPVTITTNEIRSDAQVTDLIPVGASAGGDVGFELSFEAADDLIASSLFSSWTDAPKKTGPSAITATGAGTITLDSAADFKVDMVIRLWNTTGTDIGQGVYIIDSIATNTLTVSPWSAATNAVDGSVTIGSTSTLAACGLIAAANGDISIAVASGTATVSTTSTAFADAMGSGSDLVPGQWVKLHGFDTAGNNVWARLVSVGATLTFSAPTDCVTEASPSGKVTVFYGAYVRNGTEAITSHQYAIERRYTDHTTELREVFSGMAVSQLALNFAPQEIVTGTASFLGLSSSNSTTVGDLFSGGTPTDIEAPQFNVYNTSSHVGRIGRGTDPVDQGAVNYVTAASISMTKNLRERNAIGVFGAASIGSGEFTVTGDLSAYFDNRDLLNQVIDGTETSFDIAVNSGNGRAMLFDLPRIKFSGGAPQVPGKNADVVIPLTYQALRDATLTYTAHAQRFYYAA